MMKELVKLSGEKNICICLSVKAKYLGFSPILRDTVTYHTSFPTHTRQQSAELDF